MHGLKNLKTEANFFLKNQKICSMVKRLSGLIIKQPEEQEVAQDDTAPCFNCYYGLFNKVWQVVDALQCNQLDIIGPIIQTLARLVHNSH